MQDQIVTEEDLKTRIAELEDRVRLLTGDPAAHQRLRPFGFNPRKARLLITLARAAPDAVTMPGLISVDSSSTSGLKVLICKTRKIMKAKAVPGAIETIHTSGYRADNDLAAWVLALIQPADDVQPQTEGATDATPEG